MKSTAILLTRVFALVVISCVIVAAIGTVSATSSYSASNDNTHAIAVDGTTENYSNIIVTKTGSGEGDNADFYGENAAVFATNGATLTISNAEITTNGNYANAVFSYGEGTTISISDSTIKTTQRNSGGIMVTGGGALTARNLTIETEGGSSASIRSDRGGGTIYVDGGSYTANGSGSPSIYSTADITVSNAILTSGSAQAVVVEGGNKVTLTDCDVTANNIAANSDKSDYYQAVMLYQSMSGDATGGSGSFTMNGGSLKSLNGGMFFVTNAMYAINLNAVKLAYADDELLRICAAGWGNSGNNGGQVTLNAENQNLAGNIIVDDISKLNIYLSNGSNFTGLFENDGDVYVEISDDSSWTLTADSSITSLSCKAGSIHLNGHTLTVSGEKYTEGNASTGSAIDFTENTAGGQQQGLQPELPGENNADSQQQEIPPEKPGENNANGQQQEIPPEKPGENNANGQQQEIPPEKPGENDANGQQQEIPPEIPGENNANGQQQEIPPEIPGENNANNQQQGIPPENPVATETAAESPFPVSGLLAGLSAAGLIYRLKR